MPSASPRSGSWVTAKTNSPSGPDDTPTERTPFDAGQVALEACDARHADEPGHDHTGRRDVGGRGVVLGDESGQPGRQGVLGDRRDLVIGTGRRRPGRRRPRPPRQRSPCSRPSAASRGSASAAGVCSSAEMPNRSPPSGCPPFVFVCDRSLRHRLDRRGLGDHLRGRCVGGCLDDLGRLGRHLCHRNLEDGRFHGGRRLLDGARPRPRLIGIEGRRLGQVSAIVAKRVGSSSARRRSKNAGHLGLEGRDARLDSLDAALDLGGVLLDLALELRPCGGSRARRSPRGSGRSRPWTTRGSRRRRRRPACAARSPRRTCWRGCSRRGPSPRPRTARACRRAPPRRRPAWPW